MGAASPGGMTTTLLAVVVVLLALLLLRLIGRVVGLVLRLALLAILAALLLLAFAPPRPDPAPQGPGRAAPPSAMTDDASNWLPVAPGPAVLTGRHALSSQSRPALAG